MNVDKLFKQQVESHAEKFVDKPILFFYMIEKPTEHENEIKSFKGPLSEFPIEKFKYVRSAVTTVMTVPVFRYIDA
jgi:hypothetical protein